MTASGPLWRAFLRARTGLVHRGWRLLLVPVLVVGFACALRSPADRPDLILVVIDTLRADHLPIYGYDRDTSPSLSVIAAHGLVFDRAFAHSSWTLPSMGSLLTGRYPSEHGLTRHSVDQTRFGRLRAGVTTLAEVLSRRGYRTAAFVNNTFLAPEFGLRRGFDHYDYNGASNWEIRPAEATVDAALAWLRADVRPAFVLVHIMEPHLDYDPPKATRGRFAPGEVPVEVPFHGAGRIGLMASPRPSADELAAIEALYDEEILAADMAVGRLYRELMDGPGDRPRWFWITADHGEEFWDHGGFEHGHQLFGELLRVPLIAVGPRTKAARIHAPVQHADVFRTLVDLAGGQSPSGSHGIDLLDAIASPDELEKPRPIIAEDCLYGPERVALTFGPARLVVTLPDQDASLYRLNEVGAGDVLVGEPAAATRDALLRRLKATRGSLAIASTSSNPVLLDPDSLQRLRSLGYVK